MDVQYTLYSVYSTLYREYCTVTTSLCNQCLLAVVSCVYVCGINYISLSSSCAIDYVVNIYFKSSAMGDIDKFTLLHDCYVITVCYTLLVTSGQLLVVSLWVALTIRR